jgi:hypothetical protein
MVVSVVACGLSAIGWYNVPCDLSIGVNDMVKFGAHPNILLCINGMSKFTTERRDAIMSTRPNKFFSHNTGWLNHFSMFCDTEHISMHTWRGYFKKGRNYHSLTSPFVAICMAANAGATDIIVWGVDFVNHPAFPEDSQALKSELKKYLELIGALKNHGIKVWAGTEGSILNLPVWSHSQL